MLSICITPFTLRDIEWIKHDVVNRHDLRLWRIHESESLLVHRWVLLGSGRTSCLGTVTCIGDCAIVRNLVEVCEVLALTLALIRLEGLEQTLGRTAAFVPVE